MQTSFPLDRARAQVGQKVDSMPAMLVSSVSNEELNFGKLAVMDDSEVFACKAPAPKTALDKPLGITMRQHEIESYKPKSSIVLMRSGRVWVDADKVKAPGDAVFLKFFDDGSYRFTGEVTGNTPLKGAIFLERSDGGLVPIEVNFFGGAK
jgi:hypothetical protein